MYADNSEWNEDKSFTKSIQNTTDTLLRSHYTTNAKGSSKSDDHDLASSSSERTKFLAMKKSPPPYVTYLQPHERIINACFFVSTKHAHLTSFLLKVIFVVAIIFPLAILFVTGDQNHAIESIWLPSVCAAFLIGFVLVPYMIRESVWETIDDVNNDFYEPSVSLNKHEYQPRPIEEIYYSNGLWRTTNTDHVVKFRGVNLPAKTPTYGHDPSIFYSAKKNVSFVDTPFPLNEAKAHFQRLSLYGFNLLRLIVTWEAVMHEGPGIIDTDFLNYLSQLVDIAASYGLYVIIDPHQDVWSRFTGGDGAPWWTLDAVGFDTDDDRIHQSGAAFVDHLQDANDPPPKMIWTTNYGKVATATMFTLFFAGDDYAPGVNVDEKYCNIAEGGKNNVSIQAFLQKYFLQYFDAVAKTVKDKPNVIGFNSMNEPSNGYVGVEDLRKRTFAMPFGLSMNYFDGMRVGSGDSIQVQYYSAPFNFHSRKIVNPDGLNAWKTPEHDIWQRMGVYHINPDTGNMQLLRPHYFSLKGEDFIEKYMVPLFEKIQQTIIRHNKNFIVYAEPFIDVNDHQVRYAPRSLDTNKFAWAPHWYDGSTLMFRKYIEWLALDDERQIPIFTKSWIDSSFKRILGHIRQTGNDKLHTILGEVGVPFDMDPNNYYEASTKALDRTMRAIEANDFDFTLWNYFPFNTTMKGDDWCGEDLSVRMVDRNRALLALIRPFVFKISSDFEIIRQRFDPSKKKKKYELIVKQRQTRGNGGNKQIFVYLPHFHFNCHLTYTKCNFGSIENVDKLSQCLIWDCSTVHMDNLKHEMILTIENPV